MNNLVRKSVARLEPYCPLLSGRRAYRGFLLDFNERTEPYGQVVDAALIKFVAENRLQCYPEYGDVNQLVAQYVGVKAENILLSNGSDQAIDLIFRAFAGEGDKVIIPSPSFAMFYQCAGVNGNEVLTPQYDRASGAFPLQAVLDVVDESVKLIVVCNPNNPTATLLPVAAIRRILDVAKKAVVLVDEAYVEYSGESATSLLSSYPNLIITRTFSKAFGLAALRVGYVVAASAVIDELIKIRGPYDVNMVALAAVRAVLSSLEPLRAYVREVMMVSKPLVENFFTDNKIFFYPSVADFILFRPVNPEKVFMTLKDNGFLLRPRRGYGFDGTLRLSFGTAVQTRQFIEVYKKVCLNN